MTALFRRFEAYVDQRPNGRRNLGYLLLALSIVFFLLYPVVSGASQYMKGVFIGGFFYAILASSWALLAGIAGQFSFGHMAFVGIGAYSAGLLARDGLVIAALNLNLPAESFSAVGTIIISAIFCGVVGLGLGWLLLRLRSSYLALFTIAFSELFRLVMLTEFQYTGGMNGLSPRRLVVMDDVSAARDAGYFIMFALLIVSLGLMYWLAKSRIGLFLRAMREDEDAASSLGVNIVLYKILVFVVTSMIVGLAGAVFFSNVGAERVTPEALEILQMSLIIAYAVVGGMESLLGAAIGAFLSRYILEWLRVIPLPFGWTLADGSTSIEPGFWRFALFGIVMMLTLRFMRNGLLHPVLTWFEGRGVAQRQTVSKRDRGPISDEDED